MSMIITIHQPSYFPWLGLIDKISQANTLIVLDDVQLNDNAFQSRNLFFDTNSGPHYLSIPIMKKGYLQQSIKDIKIAHHIPWQKKHSKFLINNYKKAPFFDVVYSNIQSIYIKEYEFLIDVLLDSMLLTNQLFGIHTKIIRQSELTTTINSYDKNQLISDLINSFATTMPPLPITYLSGKGALSYNNDEELFKQNISTIYQLFHHPSYHQHTNKKEFIAGLSSLDLLFNLGLTESQKIFNKVPNENFSV